HPPAARRDLPWRGRGVPAPARAAALSGEVGERGRHHRGGAEVLVGVRPHRDDPHLEPAVRARPRVLRSGGQPRLRVVVRVYVEHGAQAAGNGGAVRGVHRALHRAVEREPDDEAGAVERGVDLGDGRLVSAGGPGPADDRRPVAEREARPLDRGRREEGRQQQEGHDDRLARGSGTGVLSSRPPMPVTDAHIHVQPWWELRAEVLEVMTRGRTDVPELESIMKSPERLLRRLDQDGIARAVLVNYPSPDLMGFTARVNEYVAEYCKAAPDRLVPMGGVHPRFAE